MSEETKSDVETLHYKDDAPIEAPKEAKVGEGKSAERGEGGGFWEGLKSKLEKGVDDNNEGLKRASNKIRVKMEKIGLLLGESEQFVYNYFKLNKLMKPEEIQAEKEELAEDIGIVIETRLKIVSKFGDIINVLFDILSHIVTRASRFYSMSPKQQDAMVEEAAQGAPPNDEGLDPKIAEYARHLHISYENAKDLHEQGVFK